MSPFKKKQKNKRRKSFFRKWHRRIGFTAALFLLNLAVTGILLNHSEELKLHQNFVSSKWLVNWYGISAPTETRCLTSQHKEKPICELANNIYLGEQLLIKGSHSLIGLVAVDELYYLATRHQINIYTKQFELVEILNDKNKIPTPIRQIMSQDRFINELKVQDIIIKSDEEYYQLNSDELSWKPILVPSPITTPFFSLQPKALKSLQNQYLNQQIIYEALQLFVPFLGHYFICHRLSIS